MPLPRTHSLALVALLAGCSAVYDGRTGNLLVNPGAESGESWTSGPLPPVPGWTASGATAIAYGAGAYPAVDAPGPEDRGARFFAGIGALGTLTQTVDVSAYAEAIDAGATTFELSAYLGGFLGQTDHATVTLTFGTGTSTLGAETTLGPVTPDDRGDETGLLLRRTDGAVPPGTRTITIVIEMVRTGGLDNDGYADALSLVLVGV